MPSTANTNNPLEVAEDLLRRVEEAHYSIDQEHPGQMTLQQLLNVLIVCGLEAVEANTEANGNQTTSTALGHVADPNTPRGLQKDAMAFLRWYMGPSSPEVPDGLGGVVMTFAPHLMAGHPDACLWATAIQPDALARARAPQFWEKAKFPGHLIERVYDDSVQDPLTASEQGRD